MLEARWQEVWITLSVFLQHCVFPVLKHKIEVSSVTLICDGRNQAGAIRT